MYKVWTMGAAFRSAQCSSCSDGHRNARTFHASTTKSKAATTTISCSQKCHLLSASLAQSDLGLRASLAEAHTELHSATRAEAGKAWRAVRKDPEDLG